MCGLGRNGKRKHSCDYVSYGQTCRPRSGQLLKLFNSHEVLLIATSKEECPSHHSVYTFFTPSHTSYHNQAESKHETPAPCITGHPWIICPRTPRSQSLLSIGLPPPTPASWVRTQRIKCLHDLHIEIRSLKATLK
jgi:hypothetical protein